MYPFDVTEVVITELIANALDAGGETIAIDFDPACRKLVVADDGKGMTAREFDEYHDFAAGLKARGEGIGFAGVGAKIAFNVADLVVTKTRSESFSGGSNWYLSSRTRLVWDDVPPDHTSKTGTRVEVNFRADAELPFRSREDIVNLLRRHYLPLLDHRFLDLQAKLEVYSPALRFTVNGEMLDPGDITRDLGLSEVREFFPKRRGKRIGYGLLGLASSEYPLGHDLCGVLLCTRGKVIKADIFNQFPGALGSRIFGLVECPDFVSFLTTSKTDFVRRTKSGNFEALYGPIREEFISWLAELGIRPATVAGTDEAAKLERELRKALNEIPELSEVFGFRESAPSKRGNGVLPASMTGGLRAARVRTNGLHGPGEGPVEDETPGRLLAARTSRPPRRGPRISFADATERIDLAWVQGNSVVINTGHPSYAKASADSTARRQHCLFAIASAIQRYLAPAGENGQMMFVDRMMAAWGKK